MRPPVFLDFEASSLGRRSWPVEVAWVFADGRAESHLIRPAPGWTDWDEGAARLHGITRAQLGEEGTPLEAVARAMLERLAGQALYATAPSWDGKWLSVLLRGAGLPRHALRLEDTTLAHARTVRAVLAEAGVPEGERGALVGRVLAEAGRAAAARSKGPPVHRALPDARAELDLWRDVRSRAELAAREAAGPSRPI